MAASEDNPLGLRAGDLLRDNDARSEGRTITVKAIAHSTRGGWYAIYQGAARRAKVKFARINHDDGRPHSQGYTIVKS